MPQNTILTQELSLARMILNISVLELVKIAMLPKIRQKCSWMSQFRLLCTRLIQFILLSLSRLQYLKVNEAHFLCHLDKHFHK